MAELLKRELFGGAITIQIPRRFVDVNEFRETPDNQEAFADAHTDQSVIIEIVSQSELENKNELGKYHFEQLCQDNEVSPSESSIIFNQVLSKDEIPNLGGSDDVSKCILVGQQKISKFKEQAKNTVQIFLFVLQIPKVQSEILITLNDPISISPQSSSSGAFSNENSSETMQLFKTILNTMEIKDWSLFG